MASPATTPHFSTQQRPSRDVRIVRSASDTPAPDTAPAASRWVRAGLWTLPAYALLTLWATRTHQPDPTSDFPAYAEYISRDSFVPEHLIGSIGGTALLMLGVTALAALLAGTRSRRWALSGLASSLVGNALILTIFGVAAFVSPVIGQAYLDGNASVEAINEDIYGAPLVATAALGVLLYAAGAILLGVALHRARLLPRWAAIAFAAAGFLIGPTGLIIGEAQTAGAALFLVSTALLAWRGTRTVAAA